MNVVHAVTKQGPLVTDDSEGYPIDESFFQASGKARKGLRTAEAISAEFLWQANKSTGDYHDATNNSVIKCCLRSAACLL